jgi:lipopolysaccharide export LptBFGC system permease protein LptF
MEAPKERAWYHRYRRYEVWLHLVLGLLIAGSVALLFTSRSFTLAAGMGALLLLGGLVLLILLIVGSDIWFPRLPRDAWVEAKKDSIFAKHAKEMDSYFEALSRAGAEKDDRYKTMSPLVDEAIDLYRERYTVQLLRRGARRLLVLACIVLAFAAVARALVLVDSSSYENHLTIGSGIIDYIYFAFIAVSTIGYGDITPAAVGARLASIAFGGITLIYLLMIINYVWIHESRREHLLKEYLDERYLAVAR